MFNKKLIMFSGVLLALVGKALCLDGIAVVDHCLVDFSRPGLADIYRIDMVNNQFQKAKPLYLRANHRYKDSDGRETGYGAWSPAIDHSGNYVAFGRQTASGWKLSVMSIETGESEMYDITSLTGIPTDIQWLADGFIYYVIGNGTTVNKIFPQPNSQPQVAFTSQGKLNIFGTDAYFKRIAVLEDVNGNETNKKYDRQGTTFSSGVGFGGCSGAISPSGSTLVRYLDPGHMGENIINYDITNPRILMHDTLNLKWAVVEPDSMFPYCPGFWTQYMPLGRSGDTQGHDWSVNADDVLLATWDFVDRTDNDCGQNAILLDIADKKAWNITKNAIDCGSDWAWVDTSCYLYKSNPRKFTDPPGGIDLASNKYPGYDSSRIASGILKIASSSGARSDFWVSTLSKVNDTLRCYVADKALWKEYWGKVLKGQSATAPSWRKVTVGVRYSDIRSISNQNKSLFSIRQQGNGSIQLRVEDGDLSNLRILDMKGKTCITISGVLPKENVITKLDAGVYFLEAISGNEKICQSFTIR